MEFKALVLKTSWYRKYSKPIQSVWPRRLPLDGTSLLGAGGTQSGNSIEFGGDDFFPWWRPGQAR